VPTGRSTSAKLTIWLPASFVIAAERVPARHTAGIKPVELIYQEGPMAHRDAVTRERQIKKWSRDKKLALAKGDMDRLRKLSKSRAD
jgi:predicted GIY-YIG superfamily endonuclease